MFGNLSDDVIAALPVHLSNTFNREVVALGRSRGKDYLLRSCADELRNLFAGGLNTLLGFPTERVIAAGRVAKLRGEERQHRLQHSRIELAGSVVVHVNRQLNAGRHCYVSVLGVAHLLFSPASCLPLAIST